MNLTKIWRLAWILVMKHSVLPFTSGGYVDVAGQSTDWLTSHSMFDPLQNLYEDSHQKLE